MDGELGPGGLTEEQLVDSDEIEQLVNEAVTSVVGENVFNHAKGTCLSERHASTTHGATPPCDALPTPA